MKDNHISVIFLFHFSSLLPSQRLTLLEFPFSLPLSLHRIPLLRTHILFFLSLFLRLLLLPLLLQLLSHSFFSLSDAINDDDDDDDDDNDDNDDDGNIIMIYLATFRFNSWRIFIFYTLSFLLFFFSLCFFHFYPPLPFQIITGSNKFLLKVYV